MNLTQCTNMLTVLVKVAPHLISSGCPDKLWRSSSTRSCHLLLVAICARWLSDCAQVISVPPQSTCSALSGEMQTYTSINHPQAVFDFRSSPLPRSRWFSPYLHVQSLPFCLHASRTSVYKDLYFRSGFLFTVANVQPQSNNVQYF